MKKPKKKRMRTIIIGGVLLSVFYFGPSLFGGYYWTESAALNHSLPGVEMAKVYEKEFEDKKIIIQDTGTQRYAKVIESPLGFLHKALLVSGISVETSNDKMKIAWTATQKEDEYYEVLVAAEVEDETIQKVVVTNEYPEQADATLDELEELSGLFIEMEVEDGYAAYYLELPNTQAGNFEFRGVNVEGEIVSIS